MRPGPIPIRLLLAASLLCLVCAAAIATPLSATADSSAAPTAPVWSPLSPEQLLQSDPAVEALGDSMLLGTRASLQEGIQHSTVEDPWNGHNARAPQGSGQGLAEQFRHLVNVQSVEGAVPAQARGNRAARPAPAGFVGIDVGEAADQWLRDTVQTLVESTLQLEVNERGRASFSVLGLGDFSLSVSADRSQIALTEGNESLFVVDRPPGAAGAHGPAADAPLGPIRGGSAVEQPAIRQVVELVADMASHPISLLVYCVIAAYLVLWNVLSHQRNKPLSPVRRFEPVPPAAPTAQERSARRRRSRRSGRRAHLRRSSA